MDGVLVLWDVDHTLIDSGGVSQANYALAFEMLTGHPGQEPAKTDGRTDMSIMATLLRDNGVPAHTYSVAEQLETLRLAGERNRPLLIQRGRALPGAREALITLDDIPDLVQSVVTGNVKGNAWTKLDAFTLAELLDFEVGAFGHESTVRADLVPMAQARARARGFTPERDATVLIGDTVRDVEAGQYGGAWVIGVGTGGLNLTTLHEAGATWTLADLTDTKHLITALEEARHRGPRIRESQTR